MTTTDDDNFEFPLVEAAERGDLGAEELVSPSGRWSVLSMLKDNSGDYIYRSLFLLDRQGNRVVPVHGPMRRGVTDLLAFR
jgi:hypothetical protein